MEGKQNIIPGEAPESDEEESAIFCDDIDSASLTVPQGIAVTGEAPESDSSTSSIFDEAEVLQKDDSLGSVSSALSALSSSPPVGDIPIDNRTNTSKDEARFSSLLHRKLRERNACLRRGVEDFVLHTIGTATKDLNTIDQQLLRSQVTLQEAVTSLRLLQSTLSQLNSKLSVATSVPLPIVNIGLL